jgi:tRNA pseudouridine32 synthase/23S rRNA pseudouridine746 synthase/23S rRNA pseudouridine1911/1915/1917 synthase
MTKAIRVLYEDDYLVVFDKPSGMLVIPSPRKETNTLFDVVNANITSHKLHPCHRLDRDTSGAIIFAKGKQNQQLMMREFQNSAVEKKYIAFVRGHLSRPQGEIKIPIQDFHQKKFQRHVRPKPAATRYRVLDTKRKFSVVEIVPLTGRTNQIRIHFSEIGHPLLGERIYAFGKDFDVKFRRVALHASQIKWRHPVTKKWVKVVSELPSDMSSFIGEN